MKEIYEQLLQSEDSNTQENCIKTLLEGTRKGNKEAFQYMKMVLENTDVNSNLYLNISLGLMKPEDKEWLLAADSLTCDAMVLAAMYISYRTEIEPFFDEETNEEVSIERTLLTDIPLFEYDADFEQRVFNRFCDVYMDLPYEEYYKVYGILGYTKLSTQEQSYNRLMAELKRIESGVAAYYDEDIYMELGDIYREGWEKFGFFIDRQKAKEYYIKANFDYDPLDDEPYFDPRNFKITIKGDASEFKAIIDKYTEMPGNELGIYAPTNKIMHELVGTDSAEYKGNILFVNEEGGNLVITAEMNQTATPLKYAIQKRYQQLEVDVEKC
ncbi:MAG: hypothetical protein J6U58_04830 [Bacteroidaceae bacterium]|nr:hypothetical protein [Bacteroidaceae bacterium]